MLRLIIGFSLMVSFALSSGASAQGSSGFEAEPLLSDADRVLFGDFLSSVRRGSYMNLFFSQAAGTIIVVSGSRMTMNGLSLSQFLEVVTIACDAQASVSQNNSTITSPSNQIISTTIVACFRK